MKHGMVLVAVFLSGCFSLCAMDGKKSTAQESRKRPRSPERVTSPVQAVRFIAEDAVRRTGAAGQEKIEVLLTPAQFEHLCVAAAQGYRLPHVTPTSALPVENAHAGFAFFSSLYTGATNHLKAHIIKIEREKIQQQQQLAQATQNIELLKASNVRLQMRNNEYAQQLAARSEGASSGVELAAVPQSVLTHDDESWKIFLNLGDEE